MQIPLKDLLLNDAETEDRDAGEASSSRSSKDSIDAANYLAQMELKLSEMPADNSMVNSTRRLDSLAVQIVQEVASHYGVDHEQLT